MTLPLDDPEGEVSPIPPTSAQSLVAPEVLAGLSFNPETVRAHAEEFVVEWMRGAVQRAKGAIVDLAMKRHHAVRDLAGLDLTIIDVIGEWSFRPELETAHKVGIVPESKTSP